MEGAFADAIPPWVHIKWRGGKMSTSDSQPRILEMEDGLSVPNDQWRMVRPFETIFLPFKGTSLAPIYFSVTN